MTTEVRFPAARRAYRFLPVLAAAALLAGCGGGATPTTFDLSAPGGLSRAAGSRAVMVVAEPTAVQALDSDRVIVRDSSGALSFIGGAQWADRVPALVQARLIQTFENAGRVGSVSGPGQRISPDLQLNTDIRSFSIDAATGTAVVEITARMVGDRSGRIERARLFSARVPAGAVDGPGATRALDQALSQVLVEIVRWAR
ncbi:ABC-type transport auxiliary lipoprotein family protein [Bosea sp. (in: a-proteobacteria)]|uniref:ABC-type transport auxiliary lipoprotein family protein n=1 Tax=Bosea sp. (in: a-proteobacteria) TaxID=1871050 RepID=UPI0026259A7E|nr:ABC-type transport auxiliary lipoprotein family protein [Bosea sp. (in: a-proteobacteria)]MCO5092498.1 ABC-type transport auxiliary lipoprotein family protein [Bosea sp. (in: a-proteobacteria)]